MAFEIVLMPAMTVAGYELRTTFKDNECYASIPAFWEKVHKSKMLSAISNKSDPSVLLGVYTNYTSDFSLTSGHYSFIVGAQVNNDAAQQNMIIKKIPQSKYAVFTAKGPFATAIGKTWIEIWQSKDLQRTFTADFEWYDKNSTDDENSIVKIYVAIK